MDIYPVTAETKPKMNILLYGPPGVGKTALAATAQDHPDMANVLFLNIEGGMLTIRGRKDIQAVDVRTLNDLESAFWKFANRDPSVSQFKTLVIDSGTELQTIDLESIVKDAFDKDKTHVKRTSIDELHQADYQKSTMHLRRYLRWFRDLPVNVIITALAKTAFRKVGDDSQPVQVAPQFTEKLGESVMGYVDHVWYMYVAEEPDPENPDQTVKTRNLLTQTHGIYRAKTRGLKFAPALGTVVKDPHLGKLYDLYLQSEG